MNWLEYQKEAFRTNAFLKSRYKDFLHMYMGLITESGELLDAYKKNMAYKKGLDMKNVKEEVGDWFWYFAGFLEFLGADGKSLFETKKAEIENVAHSVNKDSSIEFIGFSIHHTSRILGLILEDDTYKIERELSDSLFHMLAFCKANDFDVERILENNIEKLQARYPDKFTSERAITRDLALEESVLDE